MKRHNESVAVIGSGIAGCLAAWELNGEGYEVTLFEDRPEVLSGTSAGAIQAHLGGLYSGSVDTARECLHSAIEMKKYMPYGLNNQKAVFLVADNSEVSMDDFLDFYTGMRDYYASLPETDQVFGDPADFFRTLEAHEYSFAKNVVGGIVTQEPGLNMMAIRNEIIRNLGSSNIRLVTRSEVRDVTENNSKFRLSVHTKGEMGVQDFDQVINAGGYKARLLDHQLGDMTEYNLYLKAWGIMREERLSTNIPPFYVVRGDFMHHSPINNGLTSLITASEEGSYLGAISYGKHNPVLPDEWRQVLDKGQIPDKKKRQANIIQYAGDLFMRNANFQPVELVAGVAVSFSSSRQNRKKKGANQIIPGWQTIVPTKATNALELAKEAVENAVAYSANLRAA